MEFSDKIDSDTLNELLENINIKTVKLDNISDYVENVIKQDPLEKLKQKKTKKDIIEQELILKQEETQYLYTEDLEKLYRKNYQITDFDNTLSHVKRVEQLLNNSKREITSFDFSAEKCKSFLDTLEEKNIDITASFQASRKLPKISEEDFFIIISNFGLKKNNLKDLEVITELLDKSDFEFFLPPFNLISSLKDLNKRTFSGKIDSFAYLKHTFTSKKGRSFVRYIPVVLIKTNQTIHPLPLDYFLCMWDLSRLLVGEFFKKDLRKKDEVGILKMNGLTLQYAYCLPEIVTPNGEYFADSEAQIESIFRYLDSEKQEIIIQLKQGLLLTAEELSLSFFERRNSLKFNNNILIKGTKILLNKGEEIKTTIKDLFEHKDNSISLLLVDEDDEEIVIREKTQDFYNINIMKSEIDIDNQIFKINQDVTFYYFSGEPKKVKIDSIIQNLSSNEIFINLYLMVEDLTGQRNSSFSLEDFKNMTKVKVKTHYEYEINYSSFTGVDNVFFSTEFFQESEKKDIFLSYNSAFGIVGFYSNKESILNDLSNNESNIKSNDDSIIFKDKIETAMFRIRRGVVFSLVDTNNKYLAGASKLPITSTLVHGFFSARGIKKEIKQNLEKINKENLINSEGSLITFKHEQNRGDILSFIHAGNACAFVTENNKVIYEKKLDVNNLGELTNGISSKKSLKFSLKDEQVKINPKSKLTIISDGFPVNVENRKAFLKGIFAGYELEKFILKADNLPINKRHIAFKTILKINDAFEKATFEMVSNTPKTNIEREKAYNITKISKDFSFSPTGFFAKIIFDIKSKQSKLLYKRVSEKIENPSDYKVIRFIVEGILKSINVNTSEEESKKIESYFESLGLGKIYYGLIENISFLKTISSDKKYYDSFLKRDTVVKINDETRKIYLKALDIIIDVFSDPDERVKPIITELLLENNDFYFVSEENTSYLEKKNKIFEPLLTVKNQLALNQISTRKEVVLDLEHLLRKYIFSTIFKDDFSLFFYDIERTDYGDSLIYDKECAEDLYDALSIHAKYNDNTKEGKILGRNIFEIKNLKKIIVDNNKSTREIEVLLAHPKILVKEIRRTIDENDNINKTEPENLSQMIESQTENKTSFISGSNLDAIFEKLGIRRSI